jgi:hypothetical protein
MRYYFGWGCMGFADLGVGQRDLAGPHVGGDMAGPAGAGLGEHADGRADLAAPSIASSTAARTRTTVRPIRTASLHRLG